MLALINIKKKRKTSGLPVQHAMEEISSKSNCRCCLDIIVSLVI